MLQQLCCCLFLFVGVIKNIVSYGFIVKMVSIEGKDSYSRYDKVILSAEEVQSTMPFTKVNKDFGNWNFTIPNMITTKLQEDILKKILVIKGEYVSTPYLSERRLYDIEIECNRVGVKLPQGLNLRKQLLVSKIIDETSHRLNKNWYKIISLYLNQQKSIEELSIQFDVPPVATLRKYIAMVVSDRHVDMRYKDVNTIIRSILREEDSFHLKYLTQRDIEQLKLSKQLDQVSFGDDDLGERNASQTWENSLYSYLDKYQINYMSEESSYNQGLSCTPDALLLDDVYINGKLIRWIDSKNFYGTCASKHFVKKLEKQVAKYEDYFQGNGAIIYNLGFSKELQDRFDETLMLDRGDLLPPVSF